MALLASAAFLAPIGLPGGAVAQQNPPNPTMSNVIPEMGTGSIQGKIQSIDPNTRQVSIVTSSGPLPFVADPSVHLEGFKPGDRVDARYSRTVAWVLTPASGQVPQGATETVGGVARGGIGPGAIQVSGRVVKVDTDRHSFEVVNASGGGVYTIVVTDPSRIAMLSNVKVGTGITASISPLMITSMQDCGLLGCLF
ncbi:MAG: hypothetical protein JOY71_24390 [Acetobacteraceae bacterium]|nr:hypothetical protein [Acetobacteraceae bacterium]